MPTPFSHLVANIRLLDDPAVPAAFRAELSQHRSAFLLGSVAPDARLPDVEESREATHFYSYRAGITENPWRLMLRAHPDAFAPPLDPARRAFLTGYVAHLALDEIWTKNMLGPHFAEGDWGKDLKYRFFVLHLLLIDMDERDLGGVPPWAPPDLEAATPAEDWLPFMPLEVLAEWQALIYDQIRPDGASQTLEIFGERVKRSPKELRQLADDAAWMQAELWDHVPRPLLHTIEAQMYVHARTSLITYLDDHTTLAR